MEPTTGNKGLAAERRAANRHDSWTSALGAARGPSLKVYSPEWRAPLPWLSRSGKNGPAIYNFVIPVTFTRANP